MGYTYEIVNVNTKEVDYFSDDFCYGIGATIVIGNEPYIVTDMVVENNISCEELKDAKYF